VKNFWATLFFRARAVAQNPEKSFSKYLGNWKSFIQTWVQNHLGKFEKCYSDLHIL